MIINDIRNTLELNELMAWNIYMLNILEFRILTIQL